MGKKHIKKIKGNEINFDYPELDDMNAAIEEERMMEKKKRKKKIWKKENFD